MDFIVAIRNLVNVYRCAKGITSIFIRDAVNIINEIGSLEFRLAIDTLLNAEYSNNPLREIDRTITIMLSSIEKLEKCNKLKFQGALIVAICYSILGDKHNLERFKMKSISMFEDWLWVSRPYGMFPILGLRGRVHAKVNRERYKSFREDVTSLGLTWMGLLPDLCSGFVSNPIVFNREIAEACSNAISEYKNFVNEILS